MRKAMITFASLAALVALPTVASAQDPAAGGAAAGMATGAVTGAIVGGPVGAAVGAVAGGAIGGAAGSASTPAYVAPAPSVVVQPVPGTVVERNCRIGADGVQRCREIVR